MGECFYDFMSPHQRNGRQCEWASGKFHPWNGQTFWNMPAILVPFDRLEKGSNWGIYMYPNWVIISWIFCSQKNWKFIDFNKLIAGRFRIPKTKYILYRNLCSIPNRFWESECSKLCSHNMLFLGSGTVLVDWIIQSLLLADRNWIVLPRLSIDHNQFGRAEITADFMTFN